MKNKKLIIFGAIIMLIFATAVIIGALGIGTYPPMTGTVVDAETGQAIEGAVVLVEWTKTHGIGEHHTESYKVEEAVTDKYGKFAVPGLNERAVDSPNLTIYKKGFVAWSNRWLFPSFEKREGFLWKSTNMFKLEKFKEAYSYRKHQDFIHSSINSTIGWEKKKRFLKEYYDAEEQQVIREQRQKDQERMKGTYR